MASGRCYRLLISVRRCYVLLISVRRCYELLISASQTSSIQSVIAIMLRCVPEQVSNPVTKIRANTMTADRTELEVI